MVKHKRGIFAWLTGLLVAVGFVIGCMSPASAYVDKRTTSPLGGDDLAYLEVRFERQVDGVGWWIKRRIWDANGDFDDPCTRNGGWFVYNGGGVPVAQGEYDLQRENGCANTWVYDVKVETKCAGVSTNATYRRDFGDDVGRHIETEICHA